MLLLLVADAVPVLTWNRHEMFELELDGGALLSPVELDKLGPPARVTNQMKFEILNK